MAKAQDDKEAKTKKPTVDDKVIIDKFNANKDSETPRLDRPGLAKQLETHVQTFVNWKAGVTPNVLDSMFDIIKFIQDNGLRDKFVETWVTSSPPTFFDQIIKMMIIGNCNVEDFVTKSSKE